MIIQQILSSYKCAEAMPPHPVRKCTRVQLVHYNNDPTGRGVLRQLESACSGLCVDGFTQVSNGTHDANIQATVFYVDVYHWVPNPTLLRLARLAAVRARKLEGARWR